MFRKKIVNIVRDCKRFVIKNDDDFKLQLRYCTDTLAKIEGFLDLRIITFNEYILLTRYVNRLIDIM